MQGKRKKIGLVLEGGASRTVYSCGVLDAFLENDIITDYVIGTSAGISYAVSYCSRQKGRNREITARFMNDGRYMGKRHLLNPKNRSYYNLDFVFGEIPNRHIPFDYAAFGEFPGEVLAAVTDVSTGAADYIEVGREDKSFMALRASCALPLLFQPIKIDGATYLDGGITDSIPFVKAFEDGCDKIIVLLTRPRGYVKTPEGMMGFIKKVYKKHPKLVEAMEERHVNYNRSIRLLEKLERHGRAYVIAPEDTHGIKRTERRPEILLPFHDEGYRDALGKTLEIKAFIAREREIKD